MWLGRIWRGGPREEVEGDHEILLSFGQQTSLIPLKYLSSPQRAMNNRSILRSPQRRTLIPRPAELIPGGSCFWREEGGREGLRVCRSLVSSSLHSHFSPLTSKSADGRPPAAFLLGFVSSPSSPPLTSHPPYHGVS